MARNKNGNPISWGMIPCPAYNFADKDIARTSISSYMLARTQSMFRYDNLPDTIPQRMLELYLQTNGNVCFYKHEGNLYVFTGGLGGVPDVYYRPTIYTIANPALNLSVNATIGQDCVVVTNDSLFIGLLPMFSRYASAIVENELSIYDAMINSRLISLISASDDRTRESAELMIKRIREGDLSVIADNSLLESLKVQPYGQGSNASRITDLIENEQYLKASWFNELGLNANYNMKRESINSGESQLNNDMLIPLVDDMLRCREQGIERVNDMFGTDIRVSLASAWEDNQEEIDLEQEAIDTSPEENSEVSENDGTDD